MTTAEFAREEGLRLEPYHDVAGFPTIGVGTSCQTRSGRTCASGRRSRRPRRYGSLTATCHISSVAWSGSSTSIFG